jgi:hypothetical protein
MATKHLNKQICSADSSYNTPNEPHTKFTLWYFDQTRLTSHYFDPTMLPQLPGLASLEQHEGVTSPINTNRSIADIPGNFAP